MKKDLISLFLDNVVKNDLSGCWEWVGHGTDYGVFYGGGTIASSHRFAYEAWVGPIPDGLDLDHLCYNTRCVNPAHLEPVTHLENVRRAAERRKLLR